MQCDLKNSKNWVKWPKFPLNSLGWGKRQHLRGITLLMWTFKWGTSRSENFEWVIFNNKISVRFSCLFSMGNFWKNLPFGWTSVGHRDRSVFKTPFLKELNVILYTQSLNLINNKLDADWTYLMMKVRQKEKTKT